MLREFPMRWTTLDGSTHYSYHFYAVLTHLKVICFFFLPCSCRKLLADTWILEEPELACIAGVCRWKAYNMDKISYVARCIFCSQITAVHATWPWGCPWMPWMTTSAVYPMICPRATDTETVSNSSPFSFQSLGNSSTPCGCSSAWDGSAGTAEGSSTYTIVGFFSPDILSYSMEASIVQWLYWLNNFYLFLSSICKPPLTLSAAAGVSASGGSWVCDCWLGLHELLGMHFWLLGRPS